MGMKSSPFSSKPAPSPILLLISFHLCIIISYTSLTFFHSTGFSHAIHKCAWRLPSIKNDLFRPFHLPVPLATDQISALFSSQVCGKRKVNLFLHLLSSSWLLSPLRADFHYPSLCWKWFWQRSLLFLMWTNPVSTLQSLSCYISL